MTLASLSYGVLMLLLGVARIDRAARITLYRVLLAVWMVAAVIAAITWSLFYATILVGIAASITYLLAFLGGEALLRDWRLTREQAENIATLDNIVAELAKTLRMQSWHDEAASGPNGGEPPAPTSSGEATSGETDSSPPSSS